MPHSTARRRHRMSDERRNSMGDQDIAVTQEVLITENRYLNDRNGDLQRENDDLRRNNTELYRTFQELGQEKEALERENRQRAARQGLVNELNHQVEKERSSKERVVQKLADERSLRKREAELQQIRDEESALLQREQAQVIQNLQAEKREWRRLRTCLVDDLDYWKRRAKDMEVRVEDLENKLAFRRSERVSEALPIRPRPMSVDPRRRAEDTRYRRPMGFWIDDAP